MNRQEKRRQEREAQKSTVTYNINPAQLQKIIEERVQERILENVGKIRKDVILNMSAATCLVLHDKQGWGRVRLQRFLEEVIKQFNCVTEGYVTTNEMIDMCKEFGILIK